MYRDYLVATTGYGDDAAAFSMACALAGPDAAHVAVLVQVPVALPDCNPMGEFPVAAYMALHDQLHRKGEADRERWREALRRTGLAGEVRLAEDLLASPSQTAALQARYADLAIIGLGERGALPAEVHDQVTRMLTGSGRPLLAVPHGCRPAAFRRIAIGWRPGAHATRAVHDALPLLVRADAVDIVCVDPRRGEFEHGDDPGADIAVHLARHGCAVTVHIEAGAGDEPADVLLRRCRELGADLLVMGGYGHSRLREWILGGSTRFVLKNADLPVLLAH